MRTPLIPHARDKIGLAEGPVGILLLSRGLAASLLTYAIVLPLIGLAVATNYTFSVYYGAAGASDRTLRMAIHEALLTVGSVGGAVVAQLIVLGKSRAALRPDTLRKSK